MMLSPIYKLYDGDGVYIASVKHILHGAMLLGCLGAGTIRYGHNQIVWTEGRDGNSEESYDHTATIVADRVHNIIERQIHRKV